jgi:hypothetical protein
LIALKRAWPNQIGLVRLIGCRLNGNTFSSCVEEKLRRERDDFSPVALEKRTSAASMRRLKPCPWLDGLFPELLGSPKAPALVKLASLKNLIWTGLAKVPTGPVRQGRLELTQGRTGGTWANLNPLLLGGRRLSFSARCRSWRRLGLNRQQLQFKHKRGVRSDRSLGPLPISEVCRDKQLPFRSRRHQL